ncbi:MAG: oxidoreductase [Actinomycetota bacterium]|nr:oxidoreductase [Actinomycetota bacterium]
MTATDWTLAQGSPQRGRIAVVTGANTGVGLEVARGLATLGAGVVLACRNREAAATARDDILRTAPGARVDVVHLDVSDLASVRGCAEELRAAYPVIDILVNNAGVMHQVRRVTADGFEGDFGTNFLGPFALTGLLLDRVLAAPAGRIIAVNSKTSRGGRIAFDDLHSEKSFSSAAAYTQSKLAQLMAVFALQRRLETMGSQAISLAAHPGGTRTGILREQSRSVRWVFNGRFRHLTGWFTQAPAEGALPMLRAATDRGVTGGQFYGPGGRFEQIGPPVLVRAAGRAHDVEAQQRLWQIAEDLTGVSYPLTRGPS